jgi:hypothetical protein
MLSGVFDFVICPIASVVPIKHYQQMATQYPDADGANKIVNTDKPGNKKAKPFPATPSSGNGLAPRVGFHARIWLTVSVSSHLVICPKWQRRE